MLGEIDFRTKDGVESARLIVFGDSETVTVHLNRKKDIRTFHKHCGLGELMHHSFLYSTIGFQGHSENDLQKYFEDRIKAAIEVLSVYGRQYVEEDEKNAISIQQKQKTDKELYEDLSKFVLKVIDEVKK